MRILFIQKDFLKCSDENEIFISRNLDRFIVNVPSNIYYILVLSMEVYISIFKFNCTILSKYIQLYAKTKIDFNSIKATSSNQERCCPLYSTPFLCPAFDCFMTFL